VTLCLHVRVQIIPPRGGLERIHVTRIEGLLRPHRENGNDFKGLTEYWHDDSILT
jgi:hypothetical protein